ncbi:MAG: Fic family protein [Oscillospiraceae bacterium]
MSYSIDALTDNCYPGTSVLINKFDINDDEQLQKVEALVVSAKIAQLEQFPITGIFDFSHYKAIHRELFCDLYDWAGLVRTVDFSKKGTHFCPASDIENRARLIFGRLKEQDFFQNLSHLDYVTEIVDFYCSTNELHPYREGNGRAQRAFLTQLIRHFGRDINFSDIDGDLLMVATIQSASGVNDLLKDIFDKAIIQE